VFQHIATETVSADIYIFFVLCFQKIKIKTFRNFILQIYNKKRKWDSDVVSAAVTTVSAAVTAVVPASHVYSCLFIIVFFLQMELFRHHYTS
jgi:hypothetical protein